MPFALSLHSLVSSVGADAGFAAIVGLAILVLLYFAHARETATLREQAVVLTERLQQAEAKLAQMRRQPVVPPPEPDEAPASAASGASASAARPPSPQAAPAVGPQPVPAAPAGVGAPPLAAATRFVPGASPRPAAGPVTPAPPAPVAPAAPAPPAAPRRQPAVAALHQPATSAPAPETHSGALSAPAPAPATAAGAANGARERGDAPGTAAATAEPPTMPPPPRRSPSRPPARPAGRSRSLPPQPPPRRASRGSRRFIAAVGVLLVIGAVAGLLIATSGGGSSQAPAGTTPASNAPAANKPPPAAPAFNPASVTVAVLNGTATNNLAHKVGTKLTSGGYKQGALATASDQTRTKTVVAYLPGQRDAALHVASSLQLGASAVAPVDSSTQAIACPPPNPCGAQVIVTVGSDLATI